MDILFFGQKGHWAVDKCLEFLASMQCNVDPCLAGQGEKLPEDLGWIDYDLIVSYLSPWIIPVHIFQKARIGALNFHAGPPEYPGLGGVNFAIYDGTTEFGVTCHHMGEKPYSGNIIAVDRFPLYSSDTANSLTNRCHYFMLTMFINTMRTAIVGQYLEALDEKWARPQYTRSQVDDLRCIESSMNPDEIRRRVLSTTDPDLPGAYIELGGVRFEALSFSCQQFLPPH